MQHLRQLLRIVKIFERELLKKEINIKKIASKTFLQLLST